jgi:F0F1-type ATP synthase membrane subunit b/b'
MENDPTIRRALKKVADAEKAEKQADVALNDARERVREAREHVKLLEQEAKEGARLAKEKQAHSEMVVKSAKGLGRHGE